jgi:hypothetical protein
MSVEKCSRSELTMKVFKLYVRRGGSGSVGVPGFDWLAAALPQPRRNIVVSTFPQLCSLPYYSIS